MKVLFLAANPADQKALRLDKEASNLREQLKRVEKAKIEVEVEHVWAVQTSQIQMELLNLKPNVLHFSGHGGANVLVFEDGQGKTAPVSGKALAELISLCPSVECVLLNACYSDSMAAAIAANGKVVIGCDSAVNDDAAAAFTRGFYRARSHGETVDNAFRLARNEVRLSFGDGEADLYKITQ